MTLTDAALGIILVVCGFVLIDWIVRAVGNWLFGRGGKPKI